MHVDLMDAIVYAGKQIMDLAQVSNLFQWFLIAFVVIGTGWLALRSRKN